MMNDCDEMGMKGERYRVPRKKTRLEKWLIVISILLMFVLVAMAIFIVIALYSNLFKWKAAPKHEIVCNATKCSMEEFQFSAIKEEKSPRICNTHLCVQEAAEIINKIDFDVPPCKNFYQFACGNYARNNIPSALDNTRNVISDIGTEVNHRIRGILDSLNNTRRWENELKMKKFYKSCIDMSYFVEYCYYSETFYTAYNILRISLTSYFGLTYVSVIGGVSAAFAVFSLLSY